MPRRLEALLPLRRNTLDMLPLLVRERRLSCSRRVAVGALDKVPPRTVLRVGVGDASGRLRRVPASLNEVLSLCQLWSEDIMIQDAHVLLLLPPLLSDSTAALADMALW